MFIRFESTLINFHRCIYWEHFGDDHARSKRIRWYMKVNLISSTYINESELNRYDHVLNGILKVCFIAIINTFRFHLLAMPFVRVSFKTYLIRLAMEEWLWGSLWWAHARKALNYYGLKNGRWDEMSMRDIKIWMNEANT